MRYATWLTPRQLSNPPTAGGRLASPSVREAGSRLLGMGQRLWDGVAVALVTLFEGDADRAVDVEATARHAARLVEAGVRAIVVGGTTGESDALTVDER